MVLNLNLDKIQKLVLAKIPSVSFNKSSYLKKKKKKAFNVLMLAKEEMVLKSSKKKKKQHFLYGQMQICGVQVMNVSLRFCVNTSIGAFKILSLIGCCQEETQNYCLSYICAGMSSGDDIMLLQPWPKQGNNHSLMALWQTSGCCRSLQWSSEGSIFK